MIETNTLQNSNTNLIGPDYNLIGVNWANSTNYNEQQYSSGLNAALGEYQSYCENNKEFVIEALYKQNSGSNVEKTELNNRRIAKSLRKSNLESQLGDLNDEIQKIRSGENNIGDAPQFWIGTVILLFLTFFIFLFYSSIGYQVFVDHLGKLFPPRLFELAIRKNVLFQILLMPFVFIALAYLVHIFTINKQWLRLSAVIIITFVADCFMGYKFTFNGFIPTPDIP